MIQRKCVCGCGETVKRYFRPGHDRTYQSKLQRIEMGILQADLAPHEFNTGPWSTCAGCGGPIPTQRYDGSPFGSVGLKCTEKKKNRAAKSAVRETATYDHHQKAGNEGDVIKHVALIAAFDTVLKSSNTDIVTYADVFAGYARNPLNADKTQQWRRGIGVLNHKVGLGYNQHVALWRRWYLARPQLVGGSYPGSSVIAWDMASHNKSRATATPMGYLGKRSYGLAERIRERVCRDLRLCSGARRCGWCGLRIHRPTVRN